jgi:hypothetical protein
MKYMVMPVKTAATWNSNKIYEETFGNHRGKSFNKITNKESYTRNITHNTECNAV